ncbi:MAG TPA: response regulator [Gemmatimonadaceae bacterium]|nr:response regulator [Gemmatimonadaceae bacterium]
MTRIQLGIRGKLLLSFSLLVAIAATYMVVFLPRTVEQHALRAELRRAHFVTSITSYSLRAALFFGDETAISEVIAGAAHDESVRWIVVRDAAGKVVSTWGIPRGEAQRIARDSGMVTDDRRQYIASADVTHDGQKVGRITVAVQLDKLNAEMASARRFGALVGVLVFVFGCLLVYAIATLATRPLSAMVQTVRRIADGDLSLRAAKTSDPEVGHLVGAFNQLVDNVASSQGVMADVNHELERRVNARTAELKEAVALQRTAQKALAGSEAEARANSQQLQSLIDVAPQAIVTVDQDWKVTRWNKAADRLFGWTADEVIGRPVPFVPDDEGTSFTEMRRSIADSDLVEAKEVTRMRKDGTRIPVLISAARLNAAQSGYIAVVTDLRDRKTLEDQLRQSQKMDAVGRLAGGIAHDFNNVLTVITATTTMLLDDTDPKHHDDLNEVMTAAKRASALTRQLLTFSRQGFVQLEPVNVPTVVRRMEPMFRRLLPANIELHVAAADSPRTVRADVSQMEQLLMNLVVNAYDAMPSGGHMAIELLVTQLEPGDARIPLPGGEYQLLTVRDSGVGMDAQTLARIFEPFFTTKTVGKGTGLGLATVYAVVNSLAGHIDVESTPGRGTTFRIWLPLEAAVQAEEHAPAPVARQPVKERRVMLVEDEAPVREVLRRTLEKRGMTVVPVEDATAALEILRRGDRGIDIVVTDVMMPGMDGRAFADILARELGQIPIIFISGYAVETIRERGLMSGTHGFLQKPFTSDELVAAIDECLAECPVAA